MPVLDNGARDQYTATAAQTVFPYTFEIFAKEDVAVEVDGVLKAEGTDYTVSGVGNDSGGNITFLVGRTAGEVITIYRDMELKREQDYQQSGDFLADEVDADFDRLWLALQQQKSAYDRSIKASLSDPILNSSNTELADPATRANKALAFDSSGELTYLTATGVQTTGIYKETITATAGQSLFNTGVNYVPGSSNLSVYINGVRQEASAYSETSSNSFTITGGVDAGDLVEYVINENPELGGTVAASNVTFNGTNAANIFGQVVRDYDTVAEAQADSSLAVGQIIRIKERANALFDVIAATTNNGYDIIDGTAASVSFQLRVSESVNVKAIGALGDGVADDTAAITAALAACKTIFFPTGTYLITSAISLGFGQRLYGVNSTIRQSTTNEPIIEISSSQWMVDNLILEHSTQQTTSNTQSYGILLDGAFEGILQNLLIKNCYRGVGVNDKTLFDGSSFAYMITLQSVRCLDSSDYGFYFQNDGSVGMTTTTFTNCYAVQTSNSNGNTSSRGFYIGSHTGGVVLNGCATDKSQGTVPVLISASTNVVVNGFDIESSKITSSSLVSISSCTNVYFNSLFDANVLSGTTCSFVSVSGNSRNINISGRERSTTSTATNTYGVQSTASNEDCVINAYELISDGGYSRSDGLTPNGKRQIHSYDQQVFAEVVGIDKILEYRTAAPTSGTWAVGDRVKNTNCTNANPIEGWICIVAGTPGSWRAHSSFTVKGATGSRPSGLNAGDFGVQYLDTTLNANGQPIWWNGSAWVDSTGATV